MERPGPCLDDARLRPSQRWQSSNIVHHPIFAEISPPVIPRNDRRARIVTRATLDLPFVVTRVAMPIACYLEFENTIDCRMARKVCTTCSMASASKDQPALATPSTTSEGRDMMV